MIIIKIIILDTSYKSDTLMIPLNGYPASVKLKLDNYIYIY